MSDPRKMTFVLHYIVFLHKSLLNMVFIFIFFNMSQSHDIEFLPILPIVTHSIPGQTSVSITQRFKVKVNFIQHKYTVRRDDVAHLLQSTRIE